MLPPDLFYLFSLFFKKKKKGNWDPRLRLRLHLPCILITVWVWEVRANLIVRKGSEVKRSEWEQRRERRHIHEMRELLEEERSAVWVWLWLFLRSVRPRINKYYTVMISREDAPPCTAEWNTVEVEVCMSLTVRYGGSDSFLPSSVQTDN